MADSRISGTLAAAVTPLRDGGRRLDEDAIAPLLGFYIAGGLEGVLVLGTTGEGILLGADERRRLAELAVAERGSLHVVVHAGAQTTAETAELSAHAAAAGAAGVAVIAPPYYAFTHGELLEHFVTAAAACAPLPFYVYEFADRTGYVVPVDVVQELRDRADNVVGMKVSDAPFERVKPYVSSGLDVFIGFESVIAQGLEHGAIGTVSGVAAAFPEAIAALVRNPTPERVALAEELRVALSRHPFQASVKAALGLRGVPVRPDVRAPLQPLGAEAIDELRGELEHIVGAEMLGGVSA